MLSLRRFYYDYADTPTGRGSFVATIAATAAFAIALGAQGGSSSASQQANPIASSWQTIVTPDRDCTNDTLSPDMHLVACTQILMDYLRDVMAMPVGFRAHMLAIEEATRRFQTGETSAGSYISTLSRHTPVMVAMSRNMDRSISDFVVEFDDLVHARKGGSANARWQPHQFVIE